MPEAASVGGLFSFLLFSLLKQATLDRPLGATRRHSRLRTSSAPLQPRRAENVRELL
jgi:hypothetical protein